jgi:hypothetical protein
VVVLVWAALVWTLHRAAPDAQTCTLKRVTGVPCPTCGLTRGVTTILRDGDVPKGISYNPLVMTLGLAAILVLALRLLLGRTPRLEMSRRERAIVLWSLVVLLLANWAYVIAFVG